MKKNTSTIRENGSVLLPLSFALSVVLGGTLAPESAIAEDGLSAFNVVDVLIEDHITIEDKSRVQARNVAVDAAGNRFVIGNIVGTVDFGEAPNLQQITGTQGDIFVARYDANDNLVWIRKFDSSARNSLPATIPAGIVYDEVFDNLIIAGTFSGQLNLDTGILQSDRNTDGFVAQLDPATGDVRWANHIDGNQGIEVADLSTNGNLAVTGHFEGVAEFAGQSGSDETKLTLSPGGNDMFTVVYAFDGSIDFVLQAGGDNAEGASVSLDSGSLTVGGDFSGTIRFPDQAGRTAQSLASNGKKDGFVARYDANGQLRFVRGFGGPESDAVREVSTKFIEIYAAGNFRDTVTIGDETFTSRGASDGFVTQISGFNGNVLATSQIGGSGSEFVHSLDVDGANRSAGRVFVGGEFDSPSLTVQQRASRLDIENPHASGVDTTYVLGFDVNAGTMAPSFGQAVRGDFFSRSLTTDDTGSQLFLPGSFDEAITFGFADERIELAEPIGDVAMAIARFAPAGSQATRLQFSANRAGTIDGVEFRNEDVLAFDPASNAFTLLIDGSDIGLAGVNIDAVHSRADGSILLSINRSTDLPGLPNVRDQDIVRFVPAQLGDNTQGRFELFLRGADVALESNAEGIDAITSDALGRVVISTKGTARVSGITGRLTARDEDLLALEGDKWELVLDGSAIGLGDSSEDIRAARLDGNRVVFATQGAYSIGGLQGAGNDIIECELSANADATASNCRIMFDGNQRGLADIRIDGFSIGQ